MIQGQASMQKCLIFFACTVEILDQPPKARAIEVHECGLDVVPGWRGILATDHGHESFKDGFMRAPLAWLKIPNLGIGSSRLVRSTMPNQRTCSSVTEEYDH